jgi:hypothetical protein
MVIIKQVQDTLLVVVVELVQLVQMLLMVLDKEETVE